MIKYHPTAKTTVKIRKEIHDNVGNLSIAKQAKKFNVSIPTIVKWRNRENFEDAQHGAIKPKKSITDVEEFIICEIRKITLLPLNDLLEVITQLDIKITRSAMFRALKRNGLSNLKKYIQSLIINEPEKHKPFKEYGIGFVHIDIKYLPKINGKRSYLYVAIDRASRVVFVQIMSDKSATSAEEFLKNVINYFPFKINKILTDNGKEFTDKFCNRLKKPTGNHLFDKTCSKHNIEHRLTKPYTPKTNGMVERVNGKVKANVLDKIKFNNEEEMATAIFTYFYNYNYYIKHSSIGRLTPIEKLEELLIEKNPKIVDISKENCYNNYVIIIEDFNSKNKQILNNYSKESDIN
jgi:transposase-like protein